MENAITKKREKQSYSVARNMLVAGGTAFAKTPAPLPVKVVVAAGVAVVTGIASLSASK